MQDVRKKNGMANRFCFLSLATCLPKLVQLGYLNPFRFANFPSPPAGKFLNKKPGGKPVKKKLFNALERDKRLHKVKKGFLSFWLHAFTSFNRACFVFFVTFLLSIHLNTLPIALLVPHKKNCSFSCLSINLWFCM